MRGFIILDFGSQFTQLIARRLRELGFYSEIHSYKFPTEEIIKKNPYGIILSGGPNSVYEEGSPQRNLSELLTICPMFAVCYGMQLLTHSLGGKVTKAQHREYGLNYVTWTTQIQGVPLKQKVWMSHGDVVEAAPAGFEIIANSDGHHPAAMRSANVLAVQFHPEVAHTDHGLDLIRYFSQDMCKAPADWDAPHIKDHLMQEVRKQVGETDHVIVGLSGGVDSTVVATLLTQTLGHERVHCVFVDNGLLRKNEYENVLENYKKIGLNVRGVDASQEFLSALNGKSDPEEKRKIIGRVFIEIFDKSYDKSLPIKWLAQGTLYPDVIESVSSVGGSVTIKSHHNVGGLPEKMKLGLVEPVRELFKDEVRALGAQLGLPHELLWRHPFPGPGLAIRIMGEINEEKLRILKECDDIYISELRRHGLYEKIWQAFCVLLPVKTVGVQGDSRTYDHVLALRAVTSSDGMTADWYPFEFQFLRDVSNLITNKVKGVNRIVYDVTSKPPGTIEWE
jgi:GMP synthase (glutamine-hydrolysing)